MSRGGSPTKRPPHGILGQGCGYRVVRIKLLALQLDARRWRGTVGLEPLLDGAALVGEAVYLVTFVMGQADRREEWSTCKTGRQERVHARKTGSIIISDVIEHMYWSGTATSLASDGPAAPLLPPSPPPTVARSSASASVSATAAASAAAAAAIPTRLSLLKGSAVLPLNPGPSPGNEGS